MLFSIFWLLSMAFLANDEMQITDWPVNKWSRGELICQGASSYIPGSAGKSVVDLARGLLLEFGSPRALLEAACSRFKKARGLGNTKYAQLNACGIILAKYSPACF